MTPSTVYRLDGSNGKKSREFKIRLIGLVLTDAIERRSVRKLLEARELLQKVIHSVVPATAAEWLIRESDSVARKRSPVLQKEYMEEMLVLLQSKYGEDRVDIHAETPKKLRESQDPTSKDSTVAASGDRFPDIANAGREVLLIELSDGCTIQKTHEWYPIKNALRYGAKPPRIV